MLLSCSLKNKLQPTLEALEQVLGSPAEVVQAVSKAPSLAVMALDTMNTNVALMHGLGLSAQEAQQSVVKEPQLFCRDYGGKVMQAKLCYFEAVLGRGPREMLLEQAFFLKYGLHRIDHRVRHASWLPAYKHCLKSLQPLCSLAVLSGPLLSFQDGLTACANIFRLRQHKEKQAMSVLHVWAEGCILTLAVVLMLLSMDVELVILEVLYGSQETVLAPRCMCAPPQVSFMEHRGHTHYEAGLAWIRMTNEKFCKAYGYGMEEFQGWEQEWQQSERAVQYGLDKPRAANMSRAQAARQKRHRAKVAARRQQVIMSGD
jgi:hypothetical protein